MKFFETKLPNGLTIIGEQREGAVSVGMGFFVKTGSRDESSELSGVSHFLEHMMFKGTATRSALDVTYALGGIGAQANAYTSEETTVYYLAVLPEYTEKALELLSDMMRPALDKEEFNTEKKVILEEIALYQDRPTHVLFEKTLREHFCNHPAGNSVLGSIESVSALTRDQMQGYFDERYVASNIVLAVSGAFHWEEVVSLAKKYCNDWPEEEVSREVFPHKATPCSFALTKKGISQAHLCLAADGPSSQDEERIESEVLSLILGGSSGSRTYWEIIDKGLADSAGIGTDDMDGAGLVYGYVSARPENLKNVGEILEEILKTPLEFSEEDLERVKTKLATRQVLEGESSMRRLMSVGNNWISRGEYQTLEEEMVRIQSVSKESIANMLKRFPLAPTTRVTLTPSS